MYKLNKDNMTNLTIEVVTMTFPNHSDWCQEDNKEEEGENQLMAVLVEGILVPIVGTIGIVGRN